MTNEVKISLEKDYLRVILPSGSPYLSGLHKMYFVNIMGFRKNEEDTSFEIKETEGNLVGILVEIVGYFKEAKAEIKYAGDAKQTIKDFEADSDEFDSSRKAGIKLKSAPPKKINIPDFKRQLKSYQVAPVAHMLGVENAANFSVPGSGKTTITLAAYSILKAQGAVSKMLVVCPRAAFMSWEDEYKECFGQAPDSLRITGNANTRKRLFRAAGFSEIILLSYQMAHQEVNNLSYFLRDHKVFMVLDESHNIKKMEGGKWASSLISLAPLATRRVILSGTPVPNSLEDLWSQMTFLWPSPKILGTTEEYKDRVVGYGQHAAENIKNTLAPFYFRIPKSQLKLKAPKFHRISVGMRPYQQAIYDAIATKILAELVRIPEERTKLRAWRRARMIRLLQTASNPALLNQYSDEFKVPPMDATGLSVSEIIDKYPDFEKPAKIDSVISLVSELLSRGEKVIIWTAFIHNIKTLVGLLSEYRPRLVYGDVPKDLSENEEFNRERMIREFKSSPDFNILIANPSACSESISLHKVCHHAIYFDRTFNCTQYMQSLDRIHRIGLEPHEQVHYYIFQTKNSVDQVVDDRLIEKQKRMLKLLDDDFALLDLESSINELSDSDEDADFQAMIQNLKKQYS